MPGEVHLKKSALICENYLYWNKTMLDFKVSQDSYLFYSLMEKDQAKVAILQMGPGNLELQLTSVLQFLLRKLLLRLHGTIFS